MKIFQTIFVIFEWSVSRQTVWYINYINCGKSKEVTVDFPFSATCNVSKVHFFKIWITWDWLEITRYTINTIQPKILLEKLLKMNINKHLCAWIFEFLTNRPQYVRFQIDSSVFYSSNRVINIGLPQGTCISPALFTIYTDDCRSGTERVKIVKFADDTAILGLLDETLASFHLSER